MSEGYGTVMGIALTHQHMAVEAPHFRNGKDTDAAKRTGFHRKHLALCDVGAQSGYPHFPMQRRS